MAPIRDGRAFLDLRRLLRAERPAIVHTHSSKAGILGRLAAASVGVPAIIHSVHGWGFHPQQGRLARSLFVGLERFTSRFTTLFLAVSEANLAQGRALGIVRGENARLLRSGIRLRDFHSRARGIPAADGVTIGMVACFKPQKAPLDFIQIAELVLAREPAVRFVLVGDGEMRSAIETRLREKGIASSVTLTGWRRDIPDLMRSFDVLLHTSRWEGLPRVFPEAMATGIPIVATRVDGAPEAIEEGVSGRLFEPGDVRGMAEAVIGLARDRALRERMGRAGLARAGAWDIDAMVRAQEDLYEELLRGGRRPDGIIRPAAAGSAASNR